MRVRCLLHETTSRLELAALQMDATGRVPWWGMAAR
jgi:hypothetical protein